MAEIIVLENGYNRFIDENFVLADGTCSLVKTSSDLVLVDTLGPWNGNKLIQLINNQGFHIDDITYLVCTHSHSDHIGNLNLFTNNTKKIFEKFQNNGFNETSTSKIKKHFAGSCAYKEDLYDLNCLSDQSFELNEHMKIYKTPGHTLSCISLIVDNVNNKGKVAIVGDLFENENDILDENIWINAGSESVDLQKKNREFILNSVDYIVPGHGSIFKVKK